MIHLLPDGWPIWLYRRRDRVHSPRRSQGEDGPGASPNTFPSFLFSFSLLWDLWPLPLPLRVASRGDGVRGVSKTFVAGFLLVAINMRTRRSRMPPRSLGHEPHVGFFLPCSVDCQRSGPTGLAHETKKKKKAISQRPHQRRGGAMCFILVRAPRRAWSINCQDHVVRAAYLSFLDAAEEETWHFLVLDLVNASREEMIDSHRMRKPQPPRKCPVKKLSIDSDASDRLVAR